MEIAELCVNFFFFFFSSIMLHPFAQRVQRRPASRSSNQADETVKNKNSTDE
jgi:hypothetical protein